MFKIRAEFVDDKMERIYKLDASFEHYIDALDVVLNCDKDGVQRMYIENQENQSDIMLVWDRKSIDEMKDKFKNEKQ